MAHTMAIQIITKYKIRDSRIIRTFVVISKLEKLNCCKDFNRSSR